MSEEANKPAPVEAAAPEVDAPASKPAEAPASESTESKPEGEKTQPMLKTTAQIDEKDHAKNVKSDFKSLPVTDDPKLIRGQVRTLPPSEYPQCSPFSRLTKL